MKLKVGTLVKCILIPLLVGVVSGLISRGGMELFEMIKKPPLSPPGWIFPVVWTVLYILMGISSYLIYTADAPEEEISEALGIYGYQLFVNFWWSIFFFNLRWYLFSFIWLLLLWGLILLMLLRFYCISKPAAYLNIPYLMWVTFAGYLNVGIWWLNR